MRDDKDTVKGEVSDRRALLKGLVAGSAVVTGSKALPDNWVKPISVAIVLPGHAVTTQGDYASGDPSAPGGDGVYDGDYNDTGDYYNEREYGDYSSDHDYGEDNGTDAADDNDYYAEKL